MNMPSYIVDGSGRLILKKELFNEDILSRLRTRSKINKILSDFTKLKILYLLSFGELNVSEIVKHLSLSQSLISHHLATLRMYKIVNFQKESKIVFYSLSKLGEQLIEKYVN